MQQKIISINFNYAKIKFCLCLYYNGVSNYLRVNKSEIYKFKVHDNIRWHQFCLGSVSKDFTKDEQSKISLNGTAYDF